MRLAFAAISALAACDDGEAPPTPEVLQAIMFGSDPTDELRLEGTVVQMLNRRSLILQPEVLPNERALVVLRVTSLGLREGDTVELRGRAERLDRRALEREIGVDVIPRLESRGIDWSTVFVATDHRPAKPPNMTSVNPPEKKEAAEEKTKPELEQRRPR